MATRSRRTSAKRTRSAKRGPAAKRAGPKRAATRPKSRPRYWSGRVTRESDALTLDSKVFSQSSPARIAASLKHSALRSKRRKAKPFQSAMSMLNFYINRAGKTLPARRKRILDRAKAELRLAFGRA
jgi:hypothetical protein